MHLLVVEDDKNLNQGICFAMKKEGYQVFSAKSLGEAEDIYQREEIEFILLDLNLPDGDGMEFCQKLRETSDISIIMLTARDMETDEILGLECGADDYLTKPFSLAVLKARIVNVLKRKDLTKGNDKIYAGDFCLDTGGMKIFQKGTELNLTLTEYKLLSYFIRNTGQVLEKEQILQGVWDIAGNFVDENTLAVNIRRLRSKITPKGEEIIRTVFGVGYQFLGGV